MVAITFVGQTTGSASATTSTTFSYTSVLGDLLAIFVSRFTGTTGALSGVTDSASQTWTKATIGSVSGQNGTHIECWYMANSAAITTITINSGTSATMAWNVSEWLNTASSGVLDVASALNAGNGGNVTQRCPALQIGACCDLVISAISYPQTTGSFNSGGASPTTGWTDLTAFDNSTLTSGRAAYQIATAANNYGGSWSLGASSPTGLVTVGFLDSGTVASHPEQLFPARRAFLDRLQTW